MLARLALSVPRRAVLPRTMAVATGPDAPYVYDWPRPAVTADAVVVDTATPPSVLLIQRGHPPGRGKYALPGGFLEVDEPPALAAARELLEETGVDASRHVDGGALSLLVGAYGEAGRDPRGWCVTLCYAGVSRDGAARRAAAAGDDAAALDWHEVTALPPLAFDHKVILRDAFTMLAARERGLGQAADAQLAAALEAGAGALVGGWDKMTE